MTKYVHLLVEIVKLVTPSSVRTRQLTEQCGSMATLLTIREVAGSHIGPYTYYSVSS